MGAKVLDMQLQYYASPAAGYFASVEINRQRKERTNYEIKETIIKKSSQNRSGSVPYIGVRGGTR